MCQNKWPGNKRYRYRYIDTDTDTPWKIYRYKAKTFWGPKFNCCAFAHETSENLRLSQLWALDIKCHYAATIKGRQEKGEKGKGEMKEKRQ